MHPLAPFIRDGKPAQLTASDYANATKITIPQARGCLCKLVNMGKVRRFELRSTPVFELKESK